MTAWAAVIGAVLSCIIGVWKLFGRKAKERRRQAALARKDLDRAKEEDDPSDFLDGFGRVQ